MEELKARLRYLLDQHYHEAATPDEEAELREKLADKKAGPVIRGILQHMLEKEDAASFSEKGWEPMLRQILDGKRASLFERNTGWQVYKTEPPVPSVPLHTRRRKLKWIAAAASVLLIAGSLYWLSPGEHSPFNGVADTKSSFTEQPQIKPGGNKAYLTLADGTVVNLDSVAAGSLATQAGTHIIKKEDGRLEYVFEETAAAVPVYNTITTPMGGKYEIVLPDGTRVWLNAASSLRFPVSFTGRSRNVYLKGEGYFEVAKNADMPFYVEAGSAVVEVLGTHFNVNAYGDDHSVITTLLEGKVKLNKHASKGAAAEPVILKPGEQANLTDGQEFKINSHPDMEEVMAWKNDMFVFSGADINMIMREIARWYDVEVSYERKIPDRVFEGKISRTADLDEVLQILKLSDIHVKMQGRKILVQ